MKKLVFALCLALSLGSLTALAQGYPVHHSVNNYGVWFWGTSAEIAVGACQANTPYGGTCWYRGYW